LLILGGNPVYTAPVDVPFAKAMEKVQLRVHLSQLEDETSALCHWQIPETHFLESWSDARGHDGTASIIQPLIAPLYGGRSAHEILAAMTDRPEQSPHDIVREYWRKGVKLTGAGIRTKRGEPSPRTGRREEARAGSDAEFEARWRRWLHDGVI